MVSLRDGELADQVSGPHDENPRTRRRVLKFVPLALLVGCLLAVVIADIDTNASIRRAEAPLIRVDHQLGDTTQRLDTARHDTTTAANQRDAHNSAAETAVNQTATAHQQLTAAQGTGTSQALGIANLKQCVNGINAARAANAARNGPAASAALTGSSEACRTSIGSQAGLSYPFDFPDPDVLTVGSTYYAFSTNSVIGNIQVISSNDLVHWVSLGDALPALAAWSIPGRTWAPSVIQLGQNFVMYYTTDFAAVGAQCISYAVATQPQGPYVDASPSPLECQLAGGGSIDPSAYVDAAGTPYLTWMSDGSSGGAATLWAQQLLPDGTGFVPGQPVALLRPSKSWQHGYFEGPDMVLAGGRFVLFYSSGDWMTSGYAIGAASCAGPLGPCAQSATQPLLTSQQHISGPGGPSVFADPQGNLWMAFHAWLPNYVNAPNSRMLYVWPISIANGVAQLTP